jgi:hypothetical protein
MQIGCGAQEAFAVFIIALMPQCMTQSFPGDGVLRQGDIFEGEWLCKKDAVSISKPKGIRITLNVNATAKLEYYPISSSSEPESGYFDIRHAKKCEGTGSFPCKIDSNANIMAFEPQSANSPSGAANFLSVDAELQNKAIWKGTMDVNYCASQNTFTLDRQIGYERRKSVNEYSSLITCGDGTYQDSLAVFPICECSGSPAATTRASDCSVMQKGSTVVMLPGTKARGSVFEAPIYTKELTVSIDKVIGRAFKGGVTDTWNDLEGNVPIGLIFVTGGDTSYNAPVLWFSKDKKECTETGQAGGRLYPQPEGNASCNITHVLQATKAGGNPSQVNLTIGSGANQMHVNCTGFQTDKLIGGDCKFPDKLSAAVRLEVVVACEHSSCGGFDYVETYLSYTYKTAPSCLRAQEIVADSKKCQHGCCTYDLPLAERIAKIWAKARRSQNAKAPQSFLSNLTIDETSTYKHGRTRLPFYQWEVQWDWRFNGAPVTNWNATAHSWKTSYDWSQYWAMVFRYLDKNEDGFINEDEYNYGVDLSLASCPSKYMQSAPFVMGCNGDFGSGIFSLLLDSVEIDIASGTRDLKLTVTADHLIDLRILDISVSPPLYIVSKTSILDDVPINKGRRIYDVPGNPYGVNMKFTSEVPGTDFQSYKEHIEFQGTLQKHIRARVEYTKTDAFGMFKFATSNSTCTVPSGCSVYDLWKATVAVQFWTSFLRSKYATLDDAWTATTKYHYASDSPLSTVMIPWGTFEPYWRASLVAITGSTAPSYWGSYSSSVFRSIDKDNDAFITKSEFGEIYASLPACDKDHEYQTSVLLTGCEVTSHTTSLYIGPKGNLPLVTVGSGMSDFKLEVTRPGNTILSLTINGSSFTPTSKTCTENPGHPNHICYMWSSQSFNTTFHLINDHMKGKDLVVTYSFTPSSCSGFFGCDNYNATLAYDLALNWSTRVSSKYKSSHEAWLKALEEALLTKDTPHFDFTTFPYAWCSMAERMQQACDDGVALAFKYFDTNEDLLVVELEFAVAYGLKAGQQALQSLTGLVKTRYTMSEFPLADMATKDSCHCSSKLNEGWDGRTKRCMKRQTTRCSHCPHQLKCATSANVVGDGLQDFVGDCPYKNQQSLCSVATKSSLAFPTMIAVDEDNNIYLTDHGNNRVRMVEAASNRIMTIVGNGDIGFSGDGGDATQARIRHPAGIAVSTIQAKIILNGNTNVIVRHRVVYISDFENQRIRKATLLSNGTWIINTVVGTGEQGSNPLCDYPHTCHAASAILNNPRALALTLLGDGAGRHDLYIVDSGNRKIRRLVTYWQNGAWHVGNFSTFLGSGQPSIDLNIASMRLGPNGLLSGSWVEDNENLLLNAIYNIQIDREEENLWVIDGVNSRVFMVPLADKTIKETKGFIGRYAFYFHLHFNGNISFYGQMLTNMEKWLKYEQRSDSSGPLFAPPRTESDREVLKYGKSYWKYMSPVDGLWCAPFSPPEKCVPTVAQITKVNRLLGLCFDVDHAMFVTDQKASQMMRISEDPIIRVNSWEPNKAGAEKTRKDCNCLQYWLDWKSLGRNPDNALTQFAQNLGIRVQELCTDNPYFVATGISQTIFPEFMRVKCTTTKSCSSDPASMCYVNTTNLDHGKCNQNEPTDYCQVDGRPDIEFHEIPAMGFMGKEIRHTVKCTVNNDRINKTSPTLEELVDWYDLTLKETFFCNDTEGEFLVRFSKILGFEEPKMLEYTQNAQYVWSSPVRPPQCTQPPNVCCGLSKKVEADGKFYCEIKSKADYLIFVDYVSTESASSLRLRPSSLELERVYRRSARLAQKLFASPARSSVCSGGCACAPRRDHIHLQSSTPLRLSRGASFSVPVASLREAPQRDWMCEEPPHGLSFEAVASLAMSAQGLASVQGLAVC